MIKSIISIISIGCFIVSGQIFASNDQQKLSQKIQNLVLTQQLLQVDERYFRENSTAWVFISNEEYRRRYRQTSPSQYQYQQYKPPPQRPQVRYQSFFPVVAARKGPVSPRGTFVFNPRSLTWAAYNSRGQLVKSGRAVGGKGYCSDVRRACRTPVGHFRVYAKRGAGCVSSKYPVGQGGAKMPYCMFFRGGYAIHGSYDMPNYNASHGCIRVHPPAARWLSHNFMRIGTRVIVRPY